MNLFEYGRILLRRGWIIILLAIVAAASAFLLSRTQTPIYRATQVIIIQPSRNDLGLTEATTRLMNSYQVYLNSSLRAQQVIDELQLDMLPNDLLSRVTIASDRTNLTVQIDVEMTDCGIANRVAQTWGNLLIRYRNVENQTVRQEDRISAIPADNARCPTAQRPNVAVNTIAGGLLGALVGGVIVFALEYIESSIVRRREDIERSLELPVLASIPYLD
ncbi:MAG: Wzz/FepE/Etk N-terminal domain-containing protein [Aggregatilineales bacterium]